MSHKHRKHNQLDILHYFLFKTIKEYTSKSDEDKGDIRIGANAFILSFRSFGPGIPSGMLARGVLPEYEEIAPEGTSSWRYNVESLFFEDFFEIQSFIKNESTLIQFEKGKRKLFKVYPDSFTPPGLLFRVEWKGGLSENKILTENQVQKALRRISSRYGLPWKLSVWFNGRKLQY